MRTNRWVTRQADGSYATQLMLWFGGASGMALQQFCPNENGLSSHCATISLSTEDAVKLRDQLTAWLDDQPAAWLDDQPAAASPVKAPLNAGEHHTKGNT